MQSGTLGLYDEWLATANEGQIAYVDAIYHEAEENYSRGGDEIVECYDPEEVLESFKNVGAVKKFCKAIVERALEYRNGDDTDSEWLRYLDFKKNWVNTRR